MAKRSEVTSDLYKVADEDCIEQICPICHKVSDYSDNDHACRVCGRVYHRSCCESDGKYDDFDVSTMDRSFTSIGWSCLDCDNLAQSVLSDKDNMAICDIFETYDQNGDGSITVDEYLAACKHIQQRELTAAEITVEKEQFKKMDRDQSGEIEMLEFLAHGAARYISKYDKEALVKLLTPLEKKSARIIFNLLDKDKDGVIDYWESMTRSGLTGWYSILQRLKEVKLVGEALTQSTNDPSTKDRRKKVSVVGQHLIPQTLNVTQCDENHDGQVSWPEFLRGHALDIILARPNKSEHAVTSLFQ